MLPDVQEIAAPCQQASNQPDDLPENFNGMQAQRYCRCSPHAWP